MQAFLKRINTVGKYRISFILFLFCLLFSPPILPDINVGLIAAFWAAILLVVKYKGQLFGTLRKSGILTFAFFFSLFLLYLALTTAVNLLLIGERVQLMHYVKLWYRLFLILPMLLVASSYICLRARELKYNTKEVCSCFVLATLLQFCLVLLTLLVPKIKAAFTQIIYNNTGDAYLNIPWVMARRGFGFANSFVDAFGWGMGLIAVIPLFFIRKDNTKPILLCPILLFVSLVNARTGLIVFLLGLLFVLPHFRKTFRGSTKKEKCHAVGMMLTALLLLLLLLMMVYLANPITLQWIIGDLVSFVPEGEAPSALQEVLEQLADDSNTTTAEVLFSDSFWNLPLGLPLLFGTGHTIYGAAGYPHSDVGYINDLWMGGILGALLLYAAFFVLFQRAFRAGNSVAEKLLTLFLAAGMAVFQIKANAITFCAGLNVTLPLLFVICHQKPEQDRHLQPRPHHLQALVSVIVPIYRVEAYLARCVESIQRQTYRNLEILLVDDGSPDRCPALCDEYAARDTRIRVIHKKNGGLSDARNVGLEAAQGDYIAFVDGDDFLHPDFIGCLLAACQTNTAEIAACGHTLYYSEQLQFSTGGGGDRIYSPEQAVTDVFTDQKIIDVMAWNKLYRATLFGEGIRFPVGKLHEDVATTYRLLLRAKRVAYVDLPYYYYIQRKDSIIHQSFSEKRLELLQIVTDMAPIMRHHPTLKQAYDFYVFFNHLTLLNAMALGGYRDAKRCSQLKRETMARYTTLKQQSNPYLTKAHGLSCRLLHLGLPLYAVARRLYHWLRLFRGVLS